MEDRDIYLSLANLGSCGYKTMIKLKKYFGNLQDYFYANENHINKIPDISLKIKENIVHYKRPEYINDIKNKLINQGEDFVSFEDSIYPKLLKKIYNPPIVLFSKGNLRLLNNFMIGIVGSRKPSLYGIECCKNISKKLSSLNITIVSGMALGIDSKAHEGSMREDGRTIAVLGSSIDRAYPKENIFLMKNILENGGLILSEYPPNTSPKKFYFPMRNRIISGLSQGILVVEAGNKSGSLITVEHALEQGRNVFAIPGNITSPNSKGTNFLIKDGAKLVDSVEDILNEYGIEDKTTYVYNEDLSNEENKIVDVLKKHQNLHVDFICKYTNINIKNVLGILQVLEIKGIINEIGNKVYSASK